MLNIYQEFVRNHQYSLQILAHCKQNRDFDKLLKQYEAKPDCEERTLETFLTYPMFQVTMIFHFKLSCNKSQALIELNVEARAFYSLKVGFCSVFWSIMAFFLVL